MAAVIGLTLPVTRRATACHHGGMTTPPRARHVTAPALREVAEIWWDRDVDPIVTWDEHGIAYDLVDPGDPARRLALLRVQEAPDDPRALAAVLAEGLASCDFPPTGERASPGRVRATLRAAGVDAVPEDDDG